MRNWIVFLLFSLITLSSIGQTSYTKTLSEIKNDRLSLINNKVSIDSCRNYILDRYLNAIYPAWIGTPWDYNGYTNTPGADQLIACGYFVSTTLKHLGFNWNRYDLAKMYSHDMVIQTCSNVQDFTTVDDLLGAIENQPDNLYFVGLDNHVGLLMRYQSKMWFIHSNYLNSKGPDKETPAESRVLSNSSLYKVGVFLDEGNIQKWLSGKAFVFVR